MQRCPIAAGIRYFLHIFALVENMENKGQEVALENLKGEL